MQAKSVVTDRREFSVLFSRHHFGTFIIFVGQNIRPTRPAGRKLFVNPLPRITNLPGLETLRKIRILLLYSRWKSNRPIFVIDIVIDLHLRNKRRKGGDKTRYIHRPIRCYESVCIFFSGIYKPIHMVYKFIVFCRAKRKSEVNFVVTGIAQTKIGVKSIWIGIFLRNLRIEIDIRFNIFSRRISLEFRSGIIIIVLIASGRCNQCDKQQKIMNYYCLLYTSDAADE